MKKSIFFIAVFGLFLSACNEKHTIENEQEHEHEEVKFKYTVYTSDLELFAEADPFIVGKECNILSHFSKLVDFKPLQNANITLKLQVGGKELSETLQGSDRPGIYSFNLKPEVTGQGKLIYEISSANKNYRLEVPNIAVFKTGEEADEAAKTAEVSKTNTSVFTKEQSWKIDFKTELPANQPFGQVIKTAGQIKSLPSDEIILSAKSNGVVHFISSNYVEGRMVSANESLFTISGNQLAVNNSSVLFAEAKNNYETSKLDYERKQELAKERIVSEKDLLEARNKYENARIIYDNLERNFDETGEVVKSPIAGYIRNIFVANGKYAEPGQALATIVNDKKLLIQGEIQPRYQSLMNHFSEAVIHVMGSDKTYSLSDLNGSLVSYGKSTGDDNFMIPVNLKVDAAEELIPGDFVEMYLKISSEENKLVLPNPALLEEQGNYFVFVQLTPELFEKREVEIGQTDGELSEITAGISPNERIVSHGAMFIKLSQASGALDPHAGHVH